MLVVAAIPATAQDATLAEAKDEYIFAEYDRAIELFSEIAHSAEYDADTRIEAFRYLGRSYIAKDEEQAAREAMTELIDLEPPIVELDADAEPPPLIELYYEARQEAQGSYQVEQRDPGLQTLAVMDFTNNSVDQRERFDGLSKGLPSMMINYINNGVDLKVIERERIQWLLDELELQRQDDVVDQSTAVRTGELLGANAVVFGSYIVLNDQMRISARVVNVETGEVLLGEEVTGEAENFFALIEELSQDITRAVNVEAEETQLGSEETNSLDAMMAYSDGLEYMEQGDYRAAFGKFMEAVDHDASFVRAEQKAESLRPMLAMSGDLEGNASSRSTN
ncbi:CsgG/HfaB family protein [Longimonas halophila]|nr:CsgG/HfaB family protein [Longimonas halophila]